MDSNLLCRAASVLALLFATSCSGLGLVIEGGYANFELDGKVALGPSGGGGSLGSLRTDVQDDLGLDDRVGTPYLRADAALGIARFSASGFLHEQSGSGTLSTNFGDIPVGTDVSTEIDMRAGKLCAIFDILNLGVVRIGPGLGVSIFDIDMTVNSALNINEDIEILAPVPMLFLQGEVDLGPLSGQLGIGGMYIDAGDAEGSFIDIEGIVRYQAFESVHFFGGLRWIEIDGKGNVDDQDFDLELGLTGFMLGVGFDV